MYIADAKRLTHEGARKMMATAIDKAREAKIAISCCIVDAGGHVIVLERMDGGRFHTAALLHHQGGVRRLEQARRPRPRARSARIST